MMDGVLPILCYHKIGSEAEEGRRLNTSPQTLAQHLAHFKRRNTQFLQAKDLDGSWPKGGICLTFDDAYESMLTHGLEVLMKFRATASIYVVGGKIGQNSDWDGSMERALASEEQILTAQREGFEIGNHSCHHSRLSELSEADQESEIQECHQKLEALGVTSQSIAYPFGFFNQASMEAAARIGYKVGLGLSRRPAKESDPKLALPRIVVGYGDKLPMLLYKINIRWKLKSSKIRPHYIE